VINLTLWLFKTNLFEEVPLMNNILLSLNTIFVGLAIVFSSLLLLSLCIILLPRILGAKFNFGKSKQRDTGKEAAFSEADEKINPAETSLQSGSVLHRTETDDKDGSPVPGIDIPGTQLVAVLTSAILSHMNARPDIKIGIKSIRRTGTTSPVWNAAGRIEQMSGRL
jgi:Na+-transporting methylmalonyl-CoA/oxaloacetate decarboxylase gamma subunit